MSQSQTAGAGVALPPLADARARALPYPAAVTAAAKTPRSSTPGGAAAVGLKAVPMTTTLSAASTASTASTTSTSSIPAVVRAPPAVTPVPVPLVPPVAAAAARTTATPTATPPQPPPIFKAKRNAKPGTAPMLASAHRLFNPSSPRAAAAAAAAGWRYTPPTMTTTPVAASTADRASTPRRETPVRPPSVPGATGGGGNTNNGSTGTHSTVAAPTAPRPLKRDHSAISTAGPPAAAAAPTTTGKKLGRPPKNPLTGVPPTTTTKKRGRPRKIPRLLGAPDPGQGLRLLNQLRAVGSDSESESDTDTDSSDSVLEMDFPDDYDARRVRRRAGSRASGSSAWEDLGDSGNDDDDDDADADDASHTAGPDGKKSLWIAPSGRPYNKWPDEKGVLQGTSGALLPDGYRQDSGAAGLWPCPVRTCAHISTTLSSLGHHFPRGHRAQTFHDEGDGSFSIVDTGDGHAAGQGQGARVVSQRAVTGPWPAKATRAAAAASARPSPAPASYRPGLQTALDGRPYLQSPYGGSSFGAILPAKYAQITYPQHPWICPVRSCRRVFVAPVNLGAHFTRQHRGAQLNDNGDGTLTQVGKTTDNLAVVVSQHVRTAAEMEPLATPAPPDQAKPPAALLRAASATTTPRAADGRFSTPSASASASAPATPRPAAVKSDLPSARMFPSAVDPMVVAGAAGDLADPVPADAAALWAYVAPLLVRSDKRAPPKRACVRQFLMLPRRRAIAWNTAWLAANPFVDALPRDVASLVVQLTGDHVAAPCARCRRGEGPYAGCVIVSKDAPCELNAAVECCANCMYRCGQAQCDLRAALADRFRRLFPGVDFDEVRRYFLAGAVSRVASLTDRALRYTTLLRETTLLRAREAGGGAAAAVDGDDDDAEFAGSDRLGTKAENEDDDDNNTPARRSRRLSAKETQADEPPPRRGAAAAMTMAAAERQGVQPQTESAPRMLEMEAWEVAPGRIQAGTENIAFSNAYLTSNQLVPIDRSMSFQVVVVRPGTTQAFAADARALRVCSLAAGKLRVRLDGAAAFVMGPHGMFRAKPGTGFAVENRTYVDAYVHMTAMRV